MTVDYSRRPGSALLRKTIAAFKLLAHDMYFDTELNSLATVVRNIHLAFAECAMKFHRYVRSLRRLRAVPQLQLVVCVRELLDLAWTMIRRRQKGTDLVRAHVTWSPPSAPADTICATADVKNNKGWAQTPLGGCWRGSRADTDCWWAGWPRRRRPRAGGRRGPSWI